MDLRKFFLNRMKFFCSSDAAFVSCVSCVFFGLDVSHLGNVEFFVSILFFDFLMF